MTATGTVEHTGSGRKKWIRRLLSGCTAVFIFGLAYFAFLCLTGPVNIPFLARILAEQGSQGPAELSIADAAVDFRNPDGALVIFREAHLKIDGETPVEVLLPRVEAPVSVAALLSGRIEFSSVKVQRPRLMVKLSAGDGTFPDMADLTETMNRVSDVVDGTFARRNLQMVDLENGSIDISGTMPRRFQGIDAKIRRSADRRITALARMAGRVSPWEVELLRTAPENGNERRIAMHVRGVTLAEFLREDDTRPSGKGLGLPMELKMDARLTSDGVFKSTNLIGRVVNGWIQMGPTSIRFSDVALSLLWSEAVPGIRVARSHVINGNTQIYFRGMVQPPSGADELWSIKLKTDSAQFGSSDVAEYPVRIDEIIADGRADLKNRTLLIDRLAARNGNAEALAVGSVDVRADGPYVAFVMEGKEIPVAVAKQIWPITLVPPARRWIIDRVNAGTIDTVRFSSAVRPPAFDISDPDAGWSGDDLEAEMTFSDGAVSPVGEVPEIYGLQGTLKIRNETLTIDARDGKVNAEGDRTVAVPAGTFAILNLPLKHGKIGKLDVDLTGLVQDLGQIVNSKPFSVLDRSGVGDEGITGDADLNIVAEFPMEAQIDMAGVTWQARADSKNFSAAKPIKGQTIRNAAITLNADPGQVAIIGKGTLNGLPADIDLVIPLEGSNVQGRQGVVVQATAEQLKSQGIDLTSFLSGSMSMTVDEADGNQVFGVDLKNTTLRLDALGWAKAKGVPARADFRLEKTDTGQEIKDFELKSDGVDIAGTITLSAEGDLTNAAFSRFQLRDGDSASLTIQGAGNGRYKIAMAGDSFDARGLIRELQKPGGGSSGGDFGNGLSISANLSRVVGFNGTRLDEFTASITTSSEGLSAARLSGKLDGRAPITFSLQQAGSGKYADGKFSDTGTLLKFLDLYQRMRGGTGQLALTMSTSTEWDGSFNVSGLSITEDPAIRQLGQRVNLRDRRDSGRVITSTAAQAGEASFETLDIAFTRSGDIVNLTRGALQGAVIGGTVGGTVNLTSQTMDLTGTFVPIYALNNIFAKIPVLGFALGGDSGEGLLGVTYRLSGAVSDPVLSVNPISAIAPGIFRKMFEFQ